MLKITQSEMKTIVLHLLPALQNKKELLTMAHTNMATHIALHNYIVEKKQLDKKFQEHHIIA